MWLVLGILAAAGSVTALLTVYAACRVSGECAEREPRRGRRELPCASSVRPSGRVQHYRA